MPLEKKQNPANVVDAQFSMPFGLAVALEKRKLTVAEFSDDVIGDQKIRELMRKIRVSPSNELDAEYPEKWPVLLRIKTKDGLIELKKDYPSGEPEDPLSFDDVANKFRSLFAGDSQAVINFVKKLERREISELLEILATEG